MSPLSFFLFAYQMKWFPFDTESPGFDSQTGSRISASVAYVVIQLINCRTYMYAVHTGTLNSSAMQTNRHDMT